MTKMTSLEAEDYHQAEVEMSYDTPAGRLRVWAVFSLIMAFLIITVALWGYAAWWAVMKLVGLFA